MYEELGKDLEQIEGLPMREYEWATRPAGDFGTYQLDFDAASLNGNDAKIEQAVEGSVDAFLHRPDKTKIRAVEAVLTKHCGPAWRKNSRQYESSTGLLHIEWVFELERE